MKMVKSLLLGSAAGLVAVTAGQAADLPVKAKPVEYVKVCSLYGAGFYYMPGTDMCIKIGGWVRAEFVWGQVNGSLTWGPFAEMPTTLPARARLSGPAAISRQTLVNRPLTARPVPISTLASTPTTPAPRSANLALSSNRAFLQWAGITAGLTQSFYDFYSVPAASFRGGYYPASDTGDPGWFTWGYTAQLGNGLSATIATEARRMTQVINQATSGPLASSGLGTITPGSFFNTTTGNTAGTAEFADWRRHRAACRPVTSSAISVSTRPGVVRRLWPPRMSSTPHTMPQLLAFDSFPGAGHPGNEWGWAVGAGLRLNFPMIAQGDYFQSQVNYTQGALRYLFFTPNSNWGKVDGYSETFGVLSDCVYGSAVAGGAAGGPATGTTSCQLTTAWGFNASYEHYWTPSVHESFFGGYYAVTYNQGTGSANAMLCGMEGNGTGSGATRCCRGRIATTTGRPLSSVPGCSGMSPSRSISAWRASTITWTAPR